ncbi:Mitochondrial sodium/calcium exchanger protein, partial [Taenia solium]
MSGPSMRLGLRKRKIFSPSLIALARSMHMSQNLAGVTLLAFGNGAPDVFSAVTAITTGDPEAPDEGLGLGFLMGSGLLVNTVTAGLIMIIRPFTTNRRPFIKDVLFYMTAVSWSAAILIRRSIHLSDSIAVDYNVKTGLAKL